MLSPHGAKVVIFLLILTTSVTSYILKPNNPLSKNPRTPLLLSPLRAEKSSSSSESDSTITTKDVVQKVAVTGPTGRTGKLVVKMLRERGVDVLALVRDMERGNKVLVEEEDDSEGLDGGLEIMVCDLGDKDEIISAVKDCDAAIWCATGFSDAPDSSLWSKLKGILGVAFTPDKSIDAVGVPALAEAFRDRKDDDDDVKYPKVVMLSSAGTTRPSWSVEKKERYKGVTDIPIVRVNPFGILDIKRVSEEKMREVGADYCIVRPCGLNQKWPINSRPIFSQGDVAVGRINRFDVAKILVDVLSQRHATGKTFEVFALTGYSPPTSIDAALSRLDLDEGTKDNVLDEKTLDVTFDLLQQLLPGTTQDASQLAMGQTYEELDAGKVGRFGKKGTEDRETIEQEML